MSWLTPTMQDLLLEALWQTLWMVGASATIAALCGLPVSLLGRGYAQGQAYPSHK